ncbi:MAG: hypothetical protein WBG32_08685 [Nodosilinea sp.]
MSLALSWGIHASHEMPRFIHTVSFETPCTATLSELFCTTKESDLTWAEVEEIAYRMTKNRTFNAVVAELGWQAKASKDMPAMITMVDKWAIVVKRELDGRRPRGRSPRDR